MGRYLLLEGNAAGWRPTFRAVPLDPAPVLREFERQGFVERCGIIGELIVDEFRHARLELLPFLTWRQAVCPDRPLAFDLLSEYRRIDPRPYVSSDYRHGWLAGP
jgi:hypothetical protein